MSSCRLPLLLGFLILPGASILLGQAKPKPNVSFGKNQDLEIELVNVPDSVGSGGKPAPTGADAKTSSEGRWLRIDVPFSTEKKITPEIKFKIFLEGYEVIEPESGGKETEKFVVLTSEVAYRDVPKGAKHFVGVFLPPASVLRFAGTKPNGETDWSNRKMNLRVEAFDQGSPCEEAFDLQADKEKGASGRGGKKNPDWNKSADAQEVPGALLPVTETPFWPKDYKRYPQIKKS
ncbi:hypothetical protein EBT23_02860 [bacterium]|nr:hypothetical protein [Verrucomicrobiota bacterium]NBS54497.1 hypothetical protein [bacterium]